MRQEHFAVRRKNWHFTAGNTIKHKIKASVALIAYFWSDTEQHPCVCSWFSRSVDLGFSLSTHRSVVLLPSGLLCFSSFIFFILSLFAPPLLHSWANWAGITPVLSFLLLSFFSYLLCFPRHPAKSFLRYVFCWRLKMSLLDSKCSRTAGLWLTGLKKNI